MYVKFNNGNIELLQSIKIDTKTFRHEALHELGYNTTNRLIWIRTIMLNVNDTSIRSKVIDDNCDAKKIVDDFELLRDELVEYITEHQDYNWYIDLSDFEDKCHKSEEEE